MTLIAIHNYSDDSVEIKRFILLIFQSDISAIASFFKP